VEQLQARYPGVEASASCPAPRATTLIRQATNLIGNAFAIGGALRRAGLGWDRTIGAYYVRDNGVGFDMVHSSRRPTLSAASGSEYPGTARLAIVKRVAGAMAGASGRFRP
jgi:hypothetical protein